MSIIRVSKRDRFVVMDKTGLEDPRLTFKATGILAYLLSKPDDWTISYRDLEKRKIEGKTAVLAALRELERNGYLKRERKHIGGRWAWEQVLYEAPLNAPKTGALTSIKNGAPKTGTLTEEGLNEGSNAPKTQTQGGFGICDKCERAVPVSSIPSHARDCSGTVVVEGVA